MRLDHEPFNRTYIPLIDLFTSIEYTDIIKDREKRLSHNYTASDVACNICKNLTKFGRCKP